METKKRTLEIMKQAGVCSLPMRNGNGQHLGIDWTVFFNVCSLPMRNGNDGTRPVCVAQAGYSL